MSVSFSTSSGVGAMPASDYGKVWLVGGTGRGRRLHTVARGTPDLRYRLSLQSTLCGRVLDWFVPDETFIEQWVAEYPFCKRCDARMQ